MNDFWSRLRTFESWPISQRVVLLGATGVGGTSIAALANRLGYLYGGSPTIDLQLLNRYILIWLAAQVVATAPSVLPARRGDVGRAAAYFFVSLQAPFIGGLLYLYGPLGTPLAAIFPALVILWTLYLNVRIGIYGLCCVGACILISGILAAYGVVPYAPLLLERSIDAQNTLVWLATVFFHLLVLIAVCVSLSVLFLSALKRQERRLDAANRELESANRMIQRYVPIQLAQQIIAGHYQIDVPPERRLLTIVFSDIEGFTSASERLSANQLGEALDEYLCEMVAIADRHGGTINQIVGDGLMIFFGAPTVTSDEDHARRAVDMALDMQSRLAELSHLWQQHGLDRPFRVRIGINTGLANVGDFGSPGRKLYSGIGLQTNLAARIQTHCEPGSVLISGSTRQYLGLDYECESLGLLPVKNVDTALPIFRVSRRAPASPADTRTPDRSS
jgi:class 3 adenylate cyclase